MKFNKNVSLRLLLAFISTIIIFLILLSKSEDQDDWHMISYRGGAYFPDVAIKPDGYPCVTWTNDDDIYLRCWNGSAWEQLGNSASSGGISDDLGRSIFPAMTISPDGIIYVAWANQETTNSRVYIKRWHNEQWEEVGLGSAMGQGVSETEGASAPDIAISSSGMLYLVWGHRFSGSIYVKRWNNEVWEEVGDHSASDSGISEMPGDSGWPAIGFDHSDNPYVVWVHKFNNDHGIFVKMFDGEQWQALGKSPISPPITTNLIGHFAIPDIAITSSGNAYVVWETDNNIFVRYWNGEEWVAQTSPHTDTFVQQILNVSIESPHIAVNTEGVLYMAWENALPREGYNVFMQLWDGDKWQDMGHNSASKGGVSDNANTKPGGHSWTISIALDKSGYPYLAWEDQRNGITEIFVRHWDGEQWQLIGNDGDVSKYAD